MAIYQVTRLGSGFGVLEDGVVIAGPFTSRQHAISRAIKLKENA